MKEKEKHILEKIKNHDKVILNELYSDCFPKIEKMVIRHGGNSAIAKDIFQDAMLIVYRKISENDLKLTCKLTTYIYSICKNLWIQEYRTGKSYINMPDYTLDHVNDAESTNYYELKLFELIDKHFNKLSKSCQKILTMHFQGKSNTEIQQAMKYQNMHYTMDRKYRCKSSLIKRIVNDPDFKELENEIKEEGNPLHRGNVR